MINLYRLLVIISLIFISYKVSLPTIKVVEKPVEVMKMDTIQVTGLIKVNKKLHKTVKILRNDNKELEIHNDILQRNYNKAIEKLLNNGS